MSQHDTQQTGSRGAETKALFFGRFQPFHLGHLKVLEWILTRFDKVLILIGMADESFTPRNPFTAIERATMIKLAVRLINIDEKRVEIATMPTLPVGVASAYTVYYMTTGFDTVVTGNHVIAEAFSAAGFKVLRPPLYERKRLQGEHIRRLMADGDPSWRNLVPEPVAEYIDAINGVERVKTIYKGLGTTR